METEDYVGLVFSLIGAVFFIAAIYWENQIITRLKKIKKQRKWEILRVLTIIFLAGYGVNFYTLIYNLTTIQLYVNSLVYLLGAVFVTYIMIISAKTYQAIFEVAEQNLGIDMKFETTPPVEIENAICK
jgi:uncharacterized membrane protein